MYVFDFSNFTINKWSCASANLEYRKEHQNSLYNGHVSRDYFDMDMDHYGVSLETQNGQLNNFWLVVWNIFYFSPPAR